MQLRARAAPSAALLLAVGCGQVGLGATVAPPAGPWLEITPEGTVLFGSASPYGHSTEAEVTLTSAGDEDIAVMDARIDVEPTGTFYFDAELPFPLSLAPGDSVPLALRFHPAAEGLYPGSLVVEVEDATELVKGLSGTGCGDDDADGQCDD